jgi:hypothetical protein
MQYSVSSQRLPGVAVASEPAPEMSMQVTSRPFQLVDTVRINACGKLPIIGQNTAERTI